MTLSRYAFEAIETRFDLHESTLPAFFTHEGSYSQLVPYKSESVDIKRLHLVVKATQKVEIANYLLSLCYDTSTGWTYAFICGDGVLYPRREDRSYGYQEDQLLDSILGSPSLWDNPLFIPHVLMQNYMERLNISARSVDIDMIALENELAVTHAGGAGRSVDMARWPQDVNPKDVTIALHSLLPHIDFMSNCCGWLQRYSWFLLKAIADFQENAELQHCYSGFRELEKMNNFSQSVIVGIDSTFATTKERGKLQVNLLFSIISQQDSLLNRSDNRLNHLIARSTKQDSISMTTFTFITALFLPSTFIATLLSMSMFDWQVSQSGDSASSQISNNSTSTVSSKFWVFWVIAVPLTLATMTGWYIWFRFANWKWTKDLSAAVADAGTTSQKSATIVNREKSYANSVVTRSWFSSMSHR